MLGYVQRTNGTPSLTLWRPAIRISLSASTRGSALCDLVNRDLDSPNSYQFRALLGARGRNRISGNSSVRFIP